MDEALIEKRKNKIVYIWGILYCQETRWYMEALGVQKTANETIVDLWEDGFVVEVIKREREGCICMW